MRLLFGLASATLNAACCGSKACAAYMQYNVAVACCKVACRCYMSHAIRCISHAACRKLVACAFDVVFACCASLLHVACCTVHVACLVPSEAGCCMLQGARCRLHFTCCSRACALGTAVIASCNNCCTLRITAASRASRTGCELFMSCCTLHVVLSCCTLHVVDMRVLQRLRRRMAAHSHTPASSSGIRVTTTTISRRRVLQGRVPRAQKRTRPRALRLCVVGLRYVL